MQSLVPGPARPLQGLIYHPVQDQDRVPGTSRRGGDEFFIMSEKHVQRAMVSCIGMVGMRRLALCIIALIALSGYALAHPPSDVTVSYNEKTGDLSVAIKHQVDNPATHYVKHVTVQQGTTVLVNQTYTSQPDKSAFTYVYNLPQLKGSVGEVTVDAECSLVGSRSGNLYLVGTTVAGTPDGAAPAPNQAPGCVFVALLAVGLAATRIMR